MKNVVFRAPLLLRSKAILIACLSVILTPAGLWAQSNVHNLQITEVCIFSGEVEVTNVGGSPVNLTQTLSFVHRDNPGTSIVPAATTFSPGQSRVFAVNGLDTFSSDLWLFEGTDFNNTANIIGGVKWGPDLGIGKISVAVAAGVWSSVTDFVPVCPPGKCLQAISPFPFSKDAWVCGNPGLGTFGLPVLVSVADTALKEGINGETILHMIVSRNNVVGLFSVDYETVDITATSGPAGGTADYIANSGTITFDPGSQVNNGSCIVVPIVVHGDIDVEQDETFEFRLSNPTGGAIIQVGKAIGTIINDDPTPTLSIDDVTVTETDSTTVNAIFTVSLSAAPGPNQFVRARVRTGDLTATAGADYTPVDLEVSFGVGMDTATVTVPVLPDDLFEGDESFGVTLSSPINAVIADGFGLGTILDDESGSRISIADVAITEGNAGVTDAVLTVRLNAMNDIPTFVNYIASSGAALLGSDFAPAMGTATVPAGQLTTTIAVPVYGDDVFEQDETFTVTLSGAVNGIITDDTAVVTILNDDMGEGLIIDDASVSEGNAAVTFMDFKVRLTAPHANLVTVSFATMNGTAIEALDYNAMSGTLTFQPGVTEQTISVVVLGDLMDEDDETIHVTLSSEMGALLLRSTATGTIVNDDDPVAPRPIVNAVSRKFGRAGDELTIFGRNFSLVAAENIVRFGAVKSPVTVVSATTLRTTIPPGATHESLTVTVGGLIGTAKGPVGVTFVNNGELDANSFGNRADFASGQKVVRVAAGDFDGDGRPDMASLNFLGNSLSVYRNLSLIPGVTPGVFGSRLDLATGLSPIDLIVADMDGDGKLDLTSVNSGAGSVSVFLNISSPGAIAFASPLVLAVGVNPSSGDAADIDGDGRLELIVTLGGSGQIGVRRNESSLGALSFGSSQAFAVGTNPAKVVAAEIDGDGKPDVLVVNSFNGAGGNSISILRNTAISGVIDAGSLASPFKLNLAPGSGPIDLADADFNCDGLVDIAVCNRAAGTVMVFENDGVPGAIDANTFLSPVVINAGLAPNSLTAADFNGDGFPDLAVAKPAADTVLLAQNRTAVNGSPLVFSAGVSVTAPGSPNAVFGGDLDGNSKAELLVAGGGGSVSVFNNLIRSITVLSWDDPGTITYGEPLAAAHLDATANVPGVFVYSPPLGTRLPAGLGQRISATFVPSDTANFHIVDTSLTIDVLPAPLTVTPNDAEKPFRAPLPVFTATFDGFVNGDTEADLDTPPSFFTEASINSAVGQYQIVVGGTADSNYDITHINPPDRVLNVGRAAPVIVWPNPEAIGFGVPLGAGQLNATADQSGLFVYDPPAETMLDVGDGQTLTVNFIPFDSFNYTSAGAEATIDIVRARPPIAWPNPADITFGVALGAGQLNATTAPAGVFTYAPSAGVVLSAGSLQQLSVMFTPNDPTRYLPVSAAATINVLRAGTVSDIMWNEPAAISFGTPLSGAQYNAVSAIAGTLVYTPPLGSFLNAGDNQKLTVTLFPSNPANYNSVSVDREIDVSKAAPTIQWTAPSEIAFGTPLSGAQQNAVVNFPGTLTYTPAAGTILNAGVGQTLTVSFAPDQPNNVETATVNRTIDVRKANPVLTWAAPADIVFGLPLTTAQLNPMANVPGTFVFDPPAGTILNAGAGQTLKATFSPSEAGNYNTVEREVTINVAKANPVLSWGNPGDIVFGAALADGVQLNATASAPGAPGTAVPGGFVYTPAAGTILNAGSGQTLSTQFTPTDTANFNVVSALARINVRKADPAIDWDDPAEIVFGTALTGLQLNAAVASPAGTLIYNPPLGTVLNPGAGQTLRVTFTPDDTANYNVRTAQATIDVALAMPTITWPTPQDIVFGAPLGNSQLNATADLPGVFVYSPAAGVFLNAGAAQTLSVTFTPFDSNFSPKTQTVDLNVNKADPLISWPNPGGIEFGTPLDTLSHLNATANVPGAFAYNPAAGFVLNAGDAQSLTATFTPTDTDNYNTVADEALINVRPATPAISWSNPANITFGAPLGAAQLNAVASGGLAGDFVYNPPAGTILNRGNFQPLSVTFTPTDSGNYLPASTAVTINVGKATPTVTWNAPADVVYGDPLSGLELNATADVPGTFIYNPPLGSVPNAGDGQVLQVSFTPDDQANYNTVAGQTSINVGKANLIVRADNKSRGISAPNPTFTATFLGLVNNDTGAGLAQPVVFTTTAISTSPAGNYDINASGAASPNYIIQYRKGILSVLANVAPTVSLTAPLNGVNRPALSDVMLSADAADSDGSVARVEFFEGLNKLGESAAPPFAFTWPSVPIGSYSLTAVATDNLNESTVSAAVTLNVLPGVNSAAVSPTGEVTVGLSGSQGVAYLIQASDDLMDDWITVGSFVATGLTEVFTDPDLATVRDRRFYRIVPASLFP